MLAGEREMAGGRCIKIHKRMSACIINCEDPARKAGIASLHIALPGRACCTNSYVIARAEIRTVGCYTERNGEP